MSPVTDPQPVTPAAVPGIAHWAPQAVPLRVARLVLSRSVRADAGAIEAGMAAVSAWPTGVVDVDVDAVVPLAAADAGPSPIVNSADEGDSAAGRESPLRFGVSREPAQMAILGGYAGHELGIVEQFGKLAGLSVGGAGSEDGPQVVSDVRELDLSQRGRHMRPALAQLRIGVRGLVSRGARPSTELVDEINEPGGRHDRNRAHHHRVNEVTTPTCGAVTKCVIYCL